MNFTIISTKEAESSETASFDVKKSVIYFTSTFLVAEPFSD